MQSKESVESAKRVESVWSLSCDNILKELRSSENGLSESEAKTRLGVHGQNVIPDKDKKHWLQILISQFTSPLLLILVVASILSAFLGDIFDAIIILTIIILSALLGFFQEYKSEKVLSELKKYLSFRTVVLRNGNKMQIDTRELVPGDIVDIGLGDIVPADLRMLTSTGIAINESVLTGESREVQKSILPMKAGVATYSPQEISNGLFMGTTVVGGHATAIVVSTGKDTFFGKTAAVFSSKVPESDFQIGIRKFGSMLIRVILVISTVVFISNYAMGHGDKNPFIDSILFALAIAIGIAPEALPAVITITLSNGSMALAKKKVVTKKLAAIEDLGNMDVLCTDKTGTLTEDIEVESYVDLDKRDSHDVLEYAVLCNSAVGTTKIRGNSVDVAIKKHGRAQQVNLSRFGKIQEIPFDFTRRRMSQVISEGKKHFLIVKGAPESVLEKCSKIKITGKEHPVRAKSREVRSMMDQYHKNGYSAIGVAYKEINQNKSKKAYSTDDEHDLIFIGFILLKNRPKPTARHTFERMKKLNVSLKILTGDDALVTRKLCGDVGFEIAENRVLLGSEIAKMETGGVEFRAAVERFNVFARVTPEQKLAIIEALRGNGHVVGFLGDGINDAPSLRTADVGISVDTAADVAKGASHIILLHKSLGVICDGIEEGRKTFGNITKYILNTMSANQGNMITVAISSFFLPFIPMLPSQILLNNVLSDLPLMSISKDNVDKKYMQKPQKWNMPYMLKFMLFFGLISTFFDLLFIVILQFVMHVDMETFRTAWFIESVLSEMLIVFSLRTHVPFFKNMPSIILILASLAASIVSFGAIYYAPVAEWFHFVPLGVPLLVLTAAVLVAYFAVTELGKVVFFSRVNSH